MRGCTGLSDSTLVENANRLVFTERRSINSFTVEYHKMLKMLIKINVAANNASFRRNSSLRAVSHESALIAKAFNFLWQRKS